MLTGARGAEEGAAGAERGAKRLLVRCCRVLCFTIGPCCRCPGPRGASTTGMPATCAPPGLRTQGVCMNHTLI